MANRKISDLTALTAPASGDFLPIVDISEAAAASKNKKITYSDFLNNIPTGTITSTMILDGTILNADINASAAIVDTKLATIATGGKVSGTAITSGNISTSGSFTSTSTVTGTNLIPTGSGVPTNGIYLPAANSVAVATNGTGRLFIDATGNVGVGAAANANGVLRLNVASGNNANLVFSENNTDRYILGQVTGDNALRVYDIVAASERLRITSAGLVGVGASNPTAKLESYFSSTNPSLSSNTGAGLSVYGTSTVRLNFGNYPASPYSSWVQSSDGIGNAWPIALNPLGGNVGIGTTAPNRKLEVSDAGVDNFIRVNTTGATKSGIEFASSGTVYSQLYFTNVSPYDLSLLQQYTTGSLILGTNSTERARITSSGRLLVGTSSANASGAKLQTADGLTFPATQVASADPNTLDDYEEGTWTPSVGGTATYSAQRGTYTKIGKVVHFSAVLVVNTIGTGSITQVTGLPFTSAVLNDGNVYVGYFGTIATSIVHLGGDINTSAVTINFYSTTAAAATTGGSAIFGNGAQVNFSGSYYV
jgi:hypothetical protein